MPEVEIPAEVQGWLQRMGLPDHAELDAVLGSCAEKYPWLLLSDWARDLDVVAKSLTEEDGRAHAAKALACRLVALDLEPADWLRLMQMARALKVISRMEVPVTKAAPIRGRSGTAHNGGRRK